MSVRFRKVLLVIVPLLVLAGFQHEPPRVVHADTLNNSVYDCIGKKEGSCGEEKAGKSGKAGADSKEEQKAGEVGVGFFDFVKMAAALLFVLVLLYGLLKVIGKKSRSYQSSRMLQSFGGLPLGGNRSLQVVKVGGRLFIVGVGENVELLKEINDEQEINQFTAQYEEQLNQTIQPADIISKWVARMKKDKPAGSQAGKPFKSILKEQLDGLSAERKRMIKKLDSKEKNADE